MVTKKKGPSILLLILAASVLATMLWNGTRPMAHIDSSYRARWSSDYSTRPSFYSQVDAPEIQLNQTGVAALEETILALERVRNPLRIGWEHLTYWANDRLYPVKIYLDSDDGPRLVYYQRGSFVFLRHALHRYDVVLQGPNSPADVETYLKPYVIGLSSDPSDTTSFPQVEALPDST